MKNNKSQQRLRIPAAGASNSADDIQDRYLKVSTLSLRGTTEHLHSLTRIRTGIQIRTRICVKPPDPWSVAPQSASCLQCTTELFTPTPHNCH